MISPVLPGLIPFALSLNYWNGLTTDSTDNQIITASGNLGDDLSPLGEHFSSPTPI